ncbi:hypothetical protein [Streptomyces avermitilis]|uniref:hypothetical protein n=1 Tax=Streptomyces avermitilis TaxID=33903 RepID=UPI0033B5D9AE
MRNTSDRTVVNKGLEAMEVVRGYKAGRITCGHYGNFRDCKECRTVHDSYIDVMLDVYGELTEAR